MTWTRLTLTGLRKFASSLAVQMPLDASAQACHSSINPIQLSGQGKSCAVYKTLRSLTNSVPVFPPKSFDLVSRLNMNDYLTAVQHRHLGCRENKRETGGKQRSGSVACRSASNHEGE